MKKITLFLLILILTFTAVAAPTILPQEQIPVLADDSTEAIGLNKLGILLGTENGFELDRNITRAEAVVLLFRMHPEITGAIGMPSPEFEDMDGHWAYKEVTVAKKIGLVDGASETTFTPDRTVSGKEFTKMMLSLLGYEDITIENAYQRADGNLILNNFTRSVIYDDRELSRGDAARICWSALVAKTADGKLLYNKLIEAGKYEENDFYGILFVTDKAVVTDTFADKINTQMPDDINYMFSPLSVKMAFAMAANGASGETKSQIENALGITDLDAFNLSTKETIQKYSEADILQLNIANSIWINSSETGQRFSADFADKMTEYYTADAFVRNNKTIVNDINGWVSDKTNAKIPSIINNDEFLAMLINAVYFKATWQNEFNESFTKPDTFTDRNGKESEIDFMNRTAYYNYYKHENCEIIELPYNTVSYNEETEEMKSYDLDISMYLVKGDYSEQALNNDLKRTYISLAIPKFKFEFSTSLKGIMQNLGIENAFVEDLADFREMFDLGNMFITDALHKTYINVDEKGTEAAAVTAIKAGTTSLPPQPVEVKYNEPFTFVIRDNDSREILFLGEYAFAEE